jgi:hypothetical protein
MRLAYIAIRGERGAPGRLAFAVAYQRFSDTLEPEARQGIEGADNAAMVVLPACPELASSPGSYSMSTEVLFPSAQAHELMPRE